MRYKKLPERIDITPDGQSQVVGWTGERSFVVADYSKPNAGVEVPNSFDLDGEDLKQEAEIMSLWDWAIKNNLSVLDLAELQESLETYIDIEDV